MEYWFIFKNLVSELSHDLFIFSGPQNVSQCLPYDIQKDINLVNIVTHPPLPIVTGK